VESDANDRGFYTLQATPTSIQSYRDGGGIFILSMTPSQDFAGKVLVSVVADPALRAELFNEFLTSETRVAEVTIRPDTTAALKSYAISVIHTHTGVSDTLICNVEMVDPIPPIESSELDLPPEFVQWLEMEHSELGIRDGQEWFSYRNDPIIVPGADLEETHLNQTWIVTVRWGLRPPWIIQPVWFLLRERGKASAMFAAVKDRNGFFREIGVDEFGLTY